MYLKFIAVALLATLLASSGFAAAPPIPKVASAPPITQSNPIWMASQVPLSHWGYIEEEFFIEGTANIFKALEAPLQIASTVPYKTRLLVRRPADSRRYSGNIILEPIHPSRSTPALATDFRWVYGNGDVWVGVEPPGNISVLQQFNPGRYASLTPVQGLTVHELLSQTSALLQSPSSPIRQMSLKDVFMQGISATCGIVSQYIILFHRDTALANGKPIVSGYMPGECSTLLPDINVPVIRINSQFDFNAKTRKPDSDDAKGRYRLYELPGAAHFSTNNSLFGEAEVVRHGSGMTATADAITCKEFGPPRYAALNDFPVWIIFDAALRNLEDWVQKGKVPPRGQPFVVDGDGKPVLDGMGNFKGGIRTPLLDSPTATWFSQGTDCSLWGYKVSFTREQLQKLYPTHEAYISQVKRQTEQLLKGGWITEEDARYVTMAAERSSIPDPEDASLIPMQPFYQYVTPESRKP